MQSEPTTNTQQHLQPNNLNDSAPNPQHGFVRRRSSASSSSVRSDHVRHGKREGLDADQLDEKLRDLSCSPKQTPGQRITEYENALSPPMPKQALGFKVIKRSHPGPDGVRIDDFPNEVLTHVLSYLHPDSHSNVCLVSKRFYALMSTPHAWRMAFLRYFPAHTALENKPSKAHGIWDEEDSEKIRSEARFFARLTPLATWRSEYLFRTRLIRSLERGKPGTGIGSSVRTSGKKNSAVLTYNSLLPWLATHVHATFSNGKKPPRVIQGASDLGMGTLSNPTTGRTEKWGSEDQFTTPLLEEEMPGHVVYGLGEGSAAAPNVMDVSQPYGLLSGTALPGGRAFFRFVHEGSGRYLSGQEHNVGRDAPGVPSIPAVLEAISSVWLAKSSTVPVTTSSMVGILTGSTLGVVTAYSLGFDGGLSRYAARDMTARWVLSPGVPIISLKVDDQYNAKRKSAERVWAVALNALGEVFYLTQPPANQVTAEKGEEMVKNAWIAGFSVYWHLVESTRRTARTHEADSRATYNPRMHSRHFKPTKDQSSARAQEIETYFHYRPSHFRDICEGWDMRRRLEVDFANDDGQGAGESIFVLDCALADDGPARIRRHVRSKASLQQQDASEQENATPPSLFGRSPEPQSPRSPPPTPASPKEDCLAVDHQWSRHTLVLKGHTDAVITASALDNSSQSTITAAEDPLYATDDTMNAPAFEIPGRRARYLVIGTKTGAILAWNARGDSGKSLELQPVRIIQTESASISCVAASALYLVHGGTDGLVQAWDPLASTTDATRTLNARPNGHVPRHMLANSPLLHTDNYSAAGAIYLDPDPTMLRGVVSFGSFMRYWAYSSAAHYSGRKRRLRHSDIHGRIASRRQGGTSSRHIAAEAAELQRENDLVDQENARLVKRFGVGALGDLTEEEAIRYAQIISQEAHEIEEERRTSDSALDTASSRSETVNSEPSVVAGPSTAAPNVESDYEQQIQQAMRLSLMEGVNEAGQSPPGDYEFERSSSNSAGSASASHTPLAAPRTELTRASLGQASNIGSSEDEDLALALSLSMQDQQQATVNGHTRLQQSEFPPLGFAGAGKGKGPKRW